ncbi:MAG: iduronate sulfatase [Planctomycetes bacterium B3_Pla]|nr:MAG: iduronate sulfatase [Planctomycetes bacterium B3_Pla]
MAGGVALSALHPAVSFGGERSGARRKKNVLFIAVDDLRPQLGCYGVKEIISPNIDRLAARGLLFERTYCQQSVCGPTRASLLSGLRPDSSKIHNNNTPVRKAIPHITTLPEHFKNNGYETLSIGKIYHHPDDDRQGWSAKPYRAGTFPEGAWKGRGYLTEEAVAQMEKYNKANPKMQGRGPAFEAADVAYSAYPDGANTDHAIKELNRLKDKPFFMAMGLYKPHLPFNAPKKYWDKYKPEDIKLADNPFVPKDAPSYAMTNWGELRNYYGIPKKGPCSDELARQLIHGYYACITYIDAMIGRLLDELDRLKLSDNTAIILWGDHGWKLGEHAGWCKHTNFELDTHVPMILSVPGMRTAGKRTKALTEYVDIYPTLSEACGLELPAHLEGCSMMPLLDDPDRSWKKAAFSQYPRGKVMGYSMRTKRFRYTEWQDTRTNKVMARELYDHAKDPQENVNAAAEPQYKQDVQRLARMLAQGWRAAMPK